MTYILIMTMWSSGRYATIATAEFDSENACRYAGAVQEMTLRNEFNYASKNYTFVCVPKDNK